MSDVETPPAPPAADERSPLVLELLEPIAGPSPAGSDVTYDDLFQQIKAEVDKLESASAAGVDYDLVVRLAREVLRERSKDLRVAIYLAMGLVQTRGLSGAADGVALIYRLVERYWEAMYPPEHRLAARRNALQGLSDRLKEWVAGEKPAEADRAALEQAIEDVRALQAFVMGRMEENAPAISGLVKAFEEALRRVPKAQQVPQNAPAASPPSAGGPAPAAPATAAAPAGGGEEGFRSVAEAERAVFRVADYLRQKERSSPTSYLLARSVRWGGLEQEPPNENGKTLIPAPIAQRRTYLAGLLERGEYGTLLEEAELSFQESPFWLDLQRYTVLAAEQLGPPFAGVRDAVLYEVALLLRRFERLPRLQFSDGTPFAEPATTGWIELRVTPVLGAEGAGGDGGGGAGAASQHVLERYREARQKLGGSDLAEVLRHMEEGTESDVGEQDRFRRRLYVASLCVSGGRAAVARPVLEELSESLRSYGLERWDPTLALEVYTVLHKCYELLGTGSGEEEMRARAREIFDRICRLDARQGLSLLGKP